MAKDNRRGPRIRLRKQGDVHYARFQVPEDVRLHFEGKREIWRSLGTGDRTQAMLRAAPILAQLDAKVRGLRGEPDALRREAMRWIGLAQSGAPYAQERIAGRAVSLTVPGGLEGLAPHIKGAASEVAAIEAAGGQPAQRFLSMATGKATRTDKHLEAFMERRRKSVEPRTAAMEEADIRSFAVALPVLQDITRQSVAGWIDKLTTEGKSVATVRRKLSAIRAYWGYLREQRDEVPSEGPTPLDKPALKENGKAAAKSGWLPFTPEDVVKLHCEAVSQGDRTLADLITLAAYTGARIEEICAVDLAHVRKGHLSIVDAKTEAGIRDVPTHSKLKPTLARLTAKRREGFLLADLEANKYGDRSRAIGKRFGRLKASMGYGGRHVFHSIRKCVTTQLERAGVGENVAADILGHEKPRVTYGIYSGGTSMAQRREAIEKVRYPKPGLG